MADLRLVFGDLVRFQIELWGAVEARLRAECDLQLTWFEVMRQLDERAGCRVQDIAEEFGITVGGTSKVVDRIEAAGYCRRAAYAASVVIIAEPQWKPSTEDQAIARCRRMGQVRKVHVHRLLVKDSVDARVQEIRDHKTLLFDHYARERDTKHSHASALPALVSVKQRVVRAEQQRLGL